MIKKILIALALALPMCAMAQKFATVDADAVLQGMAEFAEMQSKLAESSKTYEAEYAKLQDEFKAKYEEYQKILADEATPQTIKDRRLQEIQELNQRAEQFAQTVQQDLQRQQQQLMTPIQEKIINAIQAVGKEGNYTMVLPQGVAYFTSADVIDITPLVKTKLGVK